MILNAARLTSPMRFFILLSSVLALSLGGASAQIYADFTVRQGSTPLGTFRARLDYDKAPRPCANFIGLATGKRPWVDVTNGAIRTSPFYNGLTFHRLIHNFMIQGGSPNGLGTDGPGYTVLDQYHPALRHSAPYILSMAKANQPNTNGSQFFITFGATPGLDDKHSVFGEVIAGREIIDGFTNAAVFPTNNTTENRPITPIVIDSVVISGPDAESFDINDPSLSLPEVRSLRVTPSRNASLAQFAITFDRTEKTNYQMFLSENLSSWVPFRHSLNVQAQSNWTFTITGASGPSLFARVAAVSYQRIPNAPTGLVSSGKTLTLTDRSGGNIILQFNGSGGGTWTDSLSNSGTLSGVKWTDFIPDAGLWTLVNPFAQEISLGVLEVDFSSPAGPAGLTDLEVFLSFHTPTTGFIAEISVRVPRYSFVWGA